MCFWKSANRLGCYRRAWYRRNVFALFTPLNNSRKNCKAVWKIWTINVAIYFDKNPVKNVFFWWTFFGMKWKILILIWNGYLKWRIILRSLQETKRKKLSNLSKYAEIKKLVLDRFREHLPPFEFKTDFTSFCESMSGLWQNLHSSHMEWIKQF